MCHHAGIFFGQASPVTSDFWGPPRIGAGTVKVGMFKGHLQALLLLMVMMLWTDSFSAVPVQLLEFKGSLNNSEGEAIASEPLNLSWEPCLSNSVSVTTEKLSVMDTWEWNTSHILSLLIRSWVSKTEACMGSHGSFLLWLVFTASVQMEADNFFSGWW